jgi:hypothetical protein
VVELIDGLEEGIGHDEDDATRLFARGSGHRASMRLIPLGVNVTTISPSYAISFLPQLGEVAGRGVWARIATGLRRRLPNSVEASRVKTDARVIGQCNLA